MFDKSATKICNRILTVAYLKTFKRGKKAKGWMSCSMKDEKRSEM